VMSWLPFRSPPAIELLSRWSRLRLQEHRNDAGLAAARLSSGRGDGELWPLNRAVDVALIDWRRRSFNALETTLDWLVNFLKPGAVLVVWVDAQKPAANQGLRASLEKRGFVLKQGTVHDCGCAVAGRRQQTHPLQKAASRFVTSEG
jgi:hypothetical protein